MPDGLELAQAVQLIRDELLQAVQAGAGQALRFEVGTITMEFMVELRRDSGVKVGFRAWVLSGGTDAGSGRTQTHKVALTLTPASADGGQVEISDDDVDDEAALLFQPAADD